MHLQPQVPRREVVLLEEAGIVGNVHFAILADDLAGRINEHGSIVVNTSGPSLEKRSGDEHAKFASHFRQPLACRARNRLRQFEILLVLLLRKVAAGEEFLRYCQRCPALSRPARQLDSPLQVSLLVRAAGVLQQRDAGGGCGHS